MSKPDNIQELDEILELLTRATVSYERLWITVADHELSVYKAKQAILDWHNKQIEEVLDRLMGLAILGGNHIEAGCVSVSAIEAERNKLKED